MLEELSVHLCFKTTNPARYKEIRLIHRIITL